MEKVCKLCKSSIADKKNSHILSHFLIKNAINYEGRNEREREFSHVLSPDDTDTYIGNGNLTPDVLENIYEKELSESEINEIISENPSNPYARDYIFCKNCENRLGVMEHRFNEIAYEKLKQYKPITGANNGNLIVRVFVYSLIWRMSIVKFGGFSLDNKVEEHLRNILHECLSTSREDLLKKLVSNKEIITSYPLIVTFLQTSDDSDTTRNAIYPHLYSDKPYFFIINNLAIQFYTKESHTRSTPNNFFGLTKLLDTEKKINHKEDNLEISILDNKSRLHILRNIYNHLAILKVDYVIKLFRTCFLNVKNKNPTKEQEMLILEAIVNDNNTFLYDIYSKKNILRHISNFLNKMD